LLTAPGAATAPGDIWVTALVLSTAAAAVADLIWGARELTISALSRAG
jgi:hypothetical protein